MDEPLQPTFRSSAPRKPEPIELPPPAGDPTPEEIRQRCLEIQAGWTPTEEAHRRLWIPHAHGAPENFNPAEALKQVRSWHPPGAKKHAH